MKEFVVDYNEVGKFKLPVFGRLLYTIFIEVGSLD
jgi:hypothetical protein